MKFNLTANESTNEGFKFSFISETPEELAVCKELSEKLIEKISVIEIKVGGGYEE